MAKKVSVERVQETLVEFKGKALNPEVIKIIVEKLNEVNRASNKVIEKDGKKLAFCNYFGEYLPIEEFAVRSNGKVPSMSKEGQRLARTQKSLINKAINSLVEKLRKGEIKQDEFQKLMDKIDAAKAVKFKKGQAIPETYPFKY
jgi:hypothetical protein